MGAPLTYCFALISRLGLWLFSHRRSKWWRNQFKQNQGHVIDEESINRLFRFMEQKDRLTCAASGQTGQQ
jgi:hypothetical protein